MLDLLVHKDLVEIQVNEEIRDHLDRPEARVNQDNPEMSVPLDPLVRPASQGRLVLPVLRVLLVQLDQLARQDLQVLQAQWGRVDPLDPQVLWDHLVFKDLKVHLVLGVIPAILALLDLMVQVGAQVHLVRLGLVDLLGCEEILEIREIQGKVDHLVHQVLMAILGSLDLQGLKVHRDHQAIPEIQEHLDHLEIPDRMVLQVSWDRVDSQDQ